MSLAPALIQGSVMHRRTRPSRHAFAYRAFCLSIPLSSADSLPQQGIARNRAGLLAFNDADHGPRDGSPLEPWMRSLLAAHGIDAPGEIVLYTFPRMLGYLFNPVSFWLCHDRAGNVRAVLAEVNNTFGEAHNYLLAHEDGRPISEGETLEARKVFHVSPFCEVKGRYRFRFHFGGRWLARIDYHDRDEIAEPLLATSISGRTSELRPEAVRSLIWRYRWFTLAVIVRIHWQAVRLWARRVPYFSKPEPPLEPTTR